MRRVIGPLVLACLLLSLTTCNLFFPTKLTIQNSTSLNLDFVEWNDHYFGKDMVWDAVLGKYEQGIAAGNSDTVTVESASDYVSFWPASSPQHMVTVELVTMSQGEQKTYVLYDTTSVIYLSIEGSPLYTPATIPAGASSQTGTTKNPRP